MNLKKLVSKKFQGFKLSKEDKLLMEQTLIATAKKKGCYDDKAKSQIKSLLEKV